MSFDWEDMREELAQKFPDEAKSLAPFFRRAKKISDAFVRWQTLELLPRWLQFFTRLYLRITAADMFRTTKAVLDRYFQSDILKLLLASRWQALGLPTSACSFGYFAGDMTHFSDGGWYPVGGGERIAEELRKTIEDHSGTVVTGCRVDRILVDSGRVTGVQSNDEIVHCTRVISGTGAWSTYHRFLGRQESPYFDRVNSASNLNSYIMAFLALDRSPLSLGINSANHWFYADATCPPFYPKDPDLAFMTGLWVGSPSLKRGSEAHTLEFATLAPSDQFNSWRGTDWRRRPEEYEKLKKKLFDSMMEIVESRFPGLGASVIHFEVSTPLTVEHFVTQAAGGLGIPATPERLNLPWARSQTPVEGLFLTGSDVFAWGISGALAGGLKTYQLMTEGRRFKNRKQTLNVGN
jgi:all-trans-retinol 13,14-reductase